MSNTSPASSFWTYVAECVRLLYWAYFKPFTFERWLHNIHPELEPGNNPFDKQTEFRTNPRLRRYAGQVWWLSAVVPIFAVLLVAPVYTLVSGESFDWLTSCVFLVGWFIGRVVDRGVNKGNPVNNLVILLVAFPTTFLAVQFLSGVAPEVAFGVFGVGWGVMSCLRGGVAFGAPFGIVFGVAFGIAFCVPGRVAGGVTLCAVGGVAFGVTAGVALCVTVGVAFGIVLCVEFGVAFGVKTGVAFGVVGGVVFGVAGGVVFGVTAGVAFGVAFGVAWIFSVLRVYFWLPELLWIFTLFFLSHNEKQVNCLRYLPPRFDEVIILPLPLMDVMIVEDYGNNPDVARETINYLIRAC